MVTLRPGTPPLPLDLLVERADHAVPGGTLTYIGLPGTPTAPLMVRKRLEAEIHPSGRNFI